MRLLEESFSMMKYANIILYGWKDDENLLFVKALVFFINTAFKLMEVTFKNSEIIDEKKYIKGINYKSNYKNTHSIIVYHQNFWEHFHRLYLNLNQIFILIHFFNVRILIYI